jgi:predicted DNA binding protein
VGGYFPENYRAHLKRVKLVMRRINIENDGEEAGNMTVIMVGRVRKTARATHWSCATASTIAAYRTLDAHHETEIKPRICESADKIKAFIENHL